MASTLRSRASPKCFCQELWIINDTDRVNLAYTIDQEKDNKSKPFDNTIMLDTMFSTFEVTSPFRCQTIVAMLLLFWCLHYSVTFHSPLQTPLTHPPPCVSHVGPIYNIIETFWNALTFYLRRSETSYAGRLKTFCDVSRSTQDVLPASYIINVYLSFSTLTDRLNGGTWSHL